MTDEEQQPPNARTCMGAVRGRHVSSDVSGVTASVAGIVAVAMGLAVVTAVAVVLGMAMEVGEVSAEGPAVMCAGHAGLRS